MAFQNSLFNFVIGCYFLKDVYFLHQIFHFLLASTLWIRILMLCEWPPLCILYFPLSLTFSIVRALMEDLHLLDDFQLLIFSDRGRFFCMNLAHKFHKRLKLMLYA